jgi:Bardet-Biedl syndrome 1 protein
MADTIHCYSLQGTKQYTLYMPASIRDLQLLTPNSTRNTKCVVVALSNGALRVYNDKSLVSEHTNSSPVSGLFVGRYAREDNSLVTVTAAGGLDIKVCAVHVSNAQHTSWVLPHCKPSALQRATSGTLPCLQQICSLLTLPLCCPRALQIMPRTANLEVAAAAAGSSGPLPEQDVPLDVPKKTRLYVEQTQREREHAADMHKVCGPCVRMF